MRERERESEERTLTPAFAAADGTTKPEPVSAYVVVMLRKTPPVSAWIMRLPTSSVTFAVPFSTMSTIVPKPLAFRRSNGEMKLPALRYAHSLLALLLTSTTRPTAQAQVERTRC